MAFRLKFTDTPESALRRIGLSQIDRAVRALSAAELADSTIHETRKCLKRIRALLRLVRPGLEESDFQTENARYREIARQLSPARDAQILMETVLKLAPFASAAETAALEYLKQSIESGAGSRITNASDASIARALEQLTEAKAALANLNVKGSGFAPVERGLRDSYRKGLERFERAYRDGTCEAFHDVRKSVQLHWRHMALVSRAWPDMFSARVEAARQLSQILGDSQDLSVLLEYVAALPPSAIPKKSATELERLARARQDYLRAAARPRGAQIFALPPKAFARGVTKAWQAARALDDLTDDAAPHGAPTEAAAEPGPQAAPYALLEGRSEKPPATRRKRSRATA